MGNSLRFGYAFVSPMMAALAFLVLGVYSGNLAAADFQKTKCWLDIPRDREMTCGALQVPENRGKDKGAKIALATVIFQPDRERYEPVVFLSGGPGQTAGIGTREASSNDLVLIEERRLRELAADAANAGA